MFLRSPFRVRAVEDEVEFTPLPRLTSHADASAVGDHDFAGDAEAETRTPFPLARHADETIRDAYLKFDGDARSWIAHAELHTAVGGGGGWSGPNMSRCGNCYDNAAMESFWSSLKQELAYPCWVCDGLPNARRRVRVDRILLQSGAAPERHRLQLPCGL